MRPIHFLLAAVGLAAGCAFMILRPSGKNLRASRAEPIVRRTDVARAVRDNLSAAPAPAILREIPPLPHRLSARHESRKFATPQPPTHTEPVLDSPRPPLLDAESAPLTAAADIPACGIQLAENVRLPAAVMALAEIAKPTAEPVSPAVTAAQQEIVEKFYQEIAAEMARPNILPTPELEEATTVVISPSESVDDARHRADEQYRTLFGDAAYNRQGISSAIEVRLPENPGGRKLESAPQIDDARDALN